MKDLVQIKLKPEVSEDAIKVNRILNKRFLSLKKAS